VHIMPSILFMEMRNDLNGFNHSGWDVMFIWLTAIGFCYNV